MDTTAKPNIPHCCPLPLTQGDVATGKIGRGKKREKGREGIENRHNWGIGLSGKREEEKLMRGEVGSGGYSVRAGS